MFSRVLLLLASALVATSCQQSIHPQSNVVVKQVQIPDDMPWYSQFAVHSFVEYRPSPQDSWRRIEIINKTSGIRHYRISEEELQKPDRWGESVRIVAQNQVDGTRLTEEIESFAENYSDAERYLAWPGPNSNTFAEKLLRETPATGHLDHNAVGKDYGWYFGPTAGGSGIEIQSPYLGLAAGLREGFEVHFIGLTAGVGFWPPSLKLPVLPRLPSMPTLQPSPSLPER